MDEGNNTITIPHPEVWTLAARLSDRGLTYALHSRMEDNSLVFGNIGYSEIGKSRSKELEAAVYDNKFFLNQYERTVFLVESPRFLLVPDEFSLGGTQKENERYYRFAYPGDSQTILSDPIPEIGLSVVYGADTEEIAFLRRTFFNPEIVHILTPLIRYFMGKNAFGSRNKMFAYLNGDTVEVVAFKDGKFAFANYFGFSNDNDAFYHIMNAWQQNGMNPKTDELHLTGDKELRQKLLPLLRKYLANVIQAIFPAQLLRLGKDAMNAPFDLIILPLCE